MTCRNQLMNEGKPYGRSSCQDCGSILFNRICPQGVKPNPPEGSGLTEQHYVPTSQEKPKAIDKYAVIYEDTIYHEGDQRSRDFPGHGYPAYTETIQKIKTFNSLDELKNWIVMNDRGFMMPKKYTAIKYTELKVHKEVQVSLG